MAKDMQIGQTILDRYEIEDIIGQGGEATVGKATDLQTRSVVAVKQFTVPPGGPHYAEALARFNRSAGIRVGHPNVVDPIVSGQDDGESYIIMPLIDGPNLDTHLMASGGRLCVDQAVSLIVPIGQALSAVHVKGIVHRDIKPANVLLDAAMIPYLTDFGICRDLNQQTITAGDGFLGTLQYMSPEQAIDAKAVDQRSDLYSLGAMFYQMLTGSPPANGAGAASIIRHVLQDDPPAPRQRDAAIPFHVDQACMRLLAKHPDARFQSAGEFIQAVHGQLVVGPDQGNFCTSCGTAVQAGSHFCHVCGADQGGVTGQAEHCLACGAEVGNASVCRRCSRVFSQVDHRIYFFVGVLSGLTYRVPEGIYVVGRDQLAPRDGTISRRHLGVACLDGAILVHDAGSANKTYVDNTLASNPIRLVSGQQVAIAGNTGTYTSH